MKIVDVPPPTPPVAQMTRRERRLWDEFLGNHAISWEGAEIAELDYEALADYVGDPLDVYAFAMADRPGEVQYDFDNLLELCRLKLLYGGYRPKEPIALVMVYCQRCDNKLDVIRLECQRGSVDTLPFPPAMRARNARITPTTRSLQYDCSKCRKTECQVSMGRIITFFRRENEKYESWRAASSADRAYRAAGGMGPMARPRLLAGMPIRA